MTTLKKKKKFFWPFLASNNFHAEIVRDPRIVLKVSLHTIFEGSKLIWVPWGGTWGRSAWKHFFFFCQKHPFFGGFWGLTPKLRLLSNPDYPQKLAPTEAYKSLTNRFMGSLNDLGVYVSPGLNLGVSNFFPYFFTFRHKTVKIEWFYRKKFFRDLYRLRPVTHVRGP